MSNTASKFFRTAPIGAYDFIIKNSVSMYAGMVAARDSGTGYLKPNAGGAGDLIWGLVVGTPDFGTDNPPTTGGGDGVVGDTAALRPPKFGVDFRPTLLLKQAVTGVVTTNQASVGATIYLNADDHTFTLTRPTRGVPVGTVLYTWSAGVCDMLFYGLETRMAIGLAGNARREVVLGLIDFASATAATLKTLVMSFHGKIMSCLARPVIACTGSGGTVAIQPKIGGTALTGNGGLTTVSTAASATLGTNNAGAAVTDDGTNEFHEGDTVTVVGSSPGGTQTSGLVEFVAIVESLPGA